MNTAVLENVHVTDVLCLMKQKLLQFGQAVLLKQLWLSTVGWDLSARWSRKYLHPLGTSLPASGESFLQKRQNKSTNLHLSIDAKKITCNCAALFHRQNCVTDKLPTVWDAFEGLKPYSVISPGYIFVRCRCLFCSPRVGNVRTFPRIVG